MRRISSQQVFVENPITTAMRTFSMGWRQTEIINKVLIAGLTDDILSDSHCEFLLSSVLVDLDRYFHSEL